MLQFCGGTKLRDCVDISLLTNCLAVIDCANQHHGKTNQKQCQERRGVLHHPYLMTLKRISRTKSAQMVNKMNMTIFIIPFEFGKIEILLRILKY